MQCFFLKLPPPPPRPERPHHKSNGQQNGQPPAYGFNQNVVHRKLCIDTISNRNDSSYSIEHINKYMYQIWSEALSG